MSRDGVSEQVMLTDGFRIRISAGLVFYISSSTARNGNDEAKQKTMFD